MTESRHFLACNGRSVPLHPTGTAGEFVAGVRYRAWQPPSCLHPDHSGARAARVRSRRRVERALARRLHLSRRAPGRPQLRDVSGQRLRGGRPPARALPGHRPHTRTDGRARRGAQPGLPADARPSPPARAERRRSARASGCDELDHEHPHARGTDAAVALSPGVPAGRRRLRRDARRPRRAPRRSARRSSAASSRWDRRSSRRGATTRAAPSARTASPTTSTAIRRASIGPGSSTWCRSSSRRTNGAVSKTGLIQRTRLLNLILLDLHGPQRLLRSGLLPPSLALANPAFLRPCHGIPRAARHLPAHARRRPGALARWPVGRARRSHAGAVGRRLCAREPPRPPAQPAGSLPRRARFSGSPPSSARSATR